MNQKEQTETQQLQMVRTESVFSSIQAFEDAQRMVKPLASSQFIPENFRGRIYDCLIALEMAHRMGVSPMTVLQNTGSHDIIISALCKWGENHEREDPSQVP